MAAPADDRGRARRGAGLITLEVRTHNQPAIELYRKLGFEEVGKRRGYYADTGEDARLMTLFHVDDAAICRTVEVALAALERRTQPPQGGPSQEMG